MHLCWKINVAGELKSEPSEVFSQQNENIYYLQAPRLVYGVCGGVWGVEGVYYNASDVTSLLIHLVQFSASGRVYYFKGTSKVKNKASLEEEEFLSTSASCQFMHCRMKCSQLQITILLTGLCFGFLIGQSRALVSPVVLSEPQT